MFVFHLSEMKNKNSPRSNVKFRFDKLSPSAAVSLLMCVVKDGQPISRLPSNESARCLCGHCPLTVFYLICSRVTEDSRCEDRCVYGDGTRHHCTTLTPSNERRPFVTTHQPYPDAQKDQEHIAAINLFRQTVCSSFCRRSTNIRAGDEDTERRRRSQCCETL